MKLWLLTRGHTDWDQYVGFVVRADTEEQARLLAIAAARDDAEAWPSDEAVCRELTAEGPAGVMLESYHAG